jgi:HK97 family phage major capsid protein
MKLISPALFSSVAMPRAVMAMPRADGSDPKLLLASLTEAFDAFKAKNDERLGKVEAKVDPLDTEQLGKISATVLELQAALDKQAAQIAAARLGGGNITPLADADYSGIFANYFRDGASESEVKAAQKVGVRAALSEGSSANGGYTTPIEWDRTITDALKLVSPIRQEAQVIQISTIGFSRVYNDRSVGSGWVGETASRPATTTPGLTSLVWPVGEIYANAAASQDLLDDSLINISDWLTGEIEYEFARQEGIAFLSGDGVNKPSGMLPYVTGGASAAVHPFGAITSTPSGTVGGYTTDAIVTLVYALPAMFQPNAKFFANRLSMAALMKLKNGQGNYIWQPAFQAGQPATLMGAPIVDLPDMPAVASGNAALLYGDMRRTYLVVDRMGTRVLRDPYTNKPFVQFYTTKRVGGAVNNPQAMKAIVIG